MCRHFDAIIIGTGQAGPSLGARFAAAGMAVAIIERHKFGGTCVNTGCIPTKTLVASAYAAHVARRGAEYGFANCDARIDMKRVKARKDEVSGRSNRGVEEWLRGLKNCTVIQGHARFQSSRTVVVNDQVLEADKIFINVGGRASVPAMPGIHDVPFLNNSSMMDVDFLPEHLVVVGGSYVGLEFAQMYRRFGSEVTIVEMGPRLIGREDEDISQAVREILEAEGIQIWLNAKCISLAKRDTGIAVGMECLEGPPEVFGTHVLLAVGRTPNTHDLGLDRAGVATDDRGYILVDDQLQTNVPGIWALGDCNGRGAFTHTSYNDYEIVADNLLNGDHRRVSDRIQTYGLFIDPPLGRCGMTDAEIRKSGRTALITKHPMSRVSRALEKGETQGFIKISVDAETKQILGAAILGTGGDEVIHVLLDVMYAKAPYTVIQRAMHIHPTVAEFLPTVLSKLEPSPMEQNAWSKNTASPILVTGAAGRVGAIGRRVTELLLKQGKAVRAMVRNEDERAQALRDMGAEVVVGNLLDLDSMHRVIAGCETMYFGMSVSDAYLAATVNAAAVAKHHGVKAFINMSQMTLSQMSITLTTASPQQKLHWLAEQALNWSGLPVVHVRPTVLLDGFFLIFTSDSVRESNQIRLPFGQGKTSPVAVEDVARVLAALLVNPQPHIGKIYDLTGPQSENMHFYAQEYSKALGRTITYQDIPVEPWRNALLERGLPVHLVNHLVTMADLHRAGRYDRMSDDVLTLTGQEPLSVQEFVRRNVATFTAAAQAA